MKYPDFTNIEYMYLKDLPTVNPDPLQAIERVYPHTVAKCVNDIFNIYEQTVMSNSQGLRMSSKHFLVKNFASWVLERFWR